MGSRPCHPAGGLVLNPLFVLNWRNALLAGAEVLSEEDGRMRKVIGWMWCHPRLTATLAFLTFFILLNILAYRHARAMTHFVSGGPRKWRVDRLSALQKLDLVVN